MVTVGKLTCVFVRCDQQCMNVTDCACCQALSKKSNLMIHAFHMMRVMCVVRRHHFMQLSFSREISFSPSIISGRVRSVSTSHPWFQLLNQLKTNLQMPNE